MKSFSGKPVFFVICMLASFGAGAATYAVLFVSTSGESVSALMASPRNEIHEVVEREVHLSEARRNQEMAQASVVSQKSLVLRAEVVDALLSKGGLQKMFQRMGLTEEDRKQVARIQGARIAEFKRLEASHAKIVSNAEGEHVEIDPFPNQRGEWLDAVEVDLRKQLGDDRASVIARMIAFSDNDEDIGMFRRELFVTEPTDPNGKFRIEEKTYNEQGQHIDSDYELVDDQSKSRWGHLLDFGAGN